ncbi:MAG: GvpL/GvpF family gas vesicle protein, partial [Pseudomonadota bacterium]
MAQQQLHGLVPAGTTFCRDAPTHQLLSCGPISALVSDDPLSASAKTPPQDDLTRWAMAHHALLCAYARGGPVLPVQLGTVFSDKTALRAALLADQQALQRNVNELQGLQCYRFEL